MAESIVNPTQAVLDVLAERRRQITVEGWTPEHDDTHHNREMARAASAYAYASSVYGGYRPRLTSEYFDGDPTTTRELWPSGWAWKWFKPTTPRGDLIKAAALILAEIERLDRAAAKEANHD